MGKVTGFLEFKRAVRDFLPAEIINKDANCPSNAALPCSIRSLVTLPPAATICTFDFGSAGSPRREQIRSARAP